jgi:uncharacterized protein (DUF1330 family)
MAVYVVIEIKILDRDMYNEYIAGVPAIVKKYGGQYLARSEQITGLIGDWHPERIILLKFDSREQIREWLSSPEYAEIAPLRTGSTVSRAIAVEGISVS